MTPKDQLQELNKQLLQPRRSYHKYAYGLLVILLLTLYAVYSVATSSQQRTIDRLATELDNHYIAERNRLVDIVDQIIILRTQKNEVCELIPSHARTEWDKSICG